MKNYKLKASDLFTNRIIHMAEPGQPVVKLQVVGKVNLYEGDSEFRPGVKETYGWVTLRDLKTGIRHELGLGWFYKNTGTVRFFAKEKQAIRYSKRPRLLMDPPAFIPNMR